MKKKLPIYLLENGMRIVIDEIKTVETASIGMFVRVGTRDEQVGKNGVAHFLEHLIFKSNKLKNGDDITDIIEDVGGVANAYTTRELTAFEFRVLKGDLDLALKSVAKIFFKPAFEQADFENEKKIILQEMESDNANTEGVFDNEMTQLAYGNQNLGLGVLGKKNDIEKMQVQDIYDFMNSNYCAQKCVLSISGNVDKKKVLKQIVKLFSVWPYACGMVKKNDKYIGGNKLIKNGGERAYFSVFYPAPSYQNIKSVYTAKLLKMVLTGGLNSVLYQELRERRGLVYGIKSSYLTFTDNGLFSIVGSCSKDSVNKVMEILNKELKKCEQKDFINQQDLEKIKAQIRAGISFEMEGISARTSRNAYQILFYNDLYSVKNILDLIEDITSNDIAKVAQKIFGGKKSVIKII